MQCDYCGAPMTLVESRGYFRCDYCFNLHFPTPAEDSADRVIRFDASSETCCPACELKLNEALLDTHSVLFCDRCRGVLITHDDFLVVIRKRRRARQSPPDDPTPLNRDDLKRQIPCPVCSNQMDVHPYYGPGSVVIDTCPRCKVIWFDHGEIGAIERAPGKNW